MLSLIGSIQSDPFSPRHTAPAQRDAEHELEESEMEDIEVEREIDPGSEEEDEIESSRESE